MLREFIKIEILENIKSPRTIGMFLVTSILIPMSIFLNYRTLVDMRNNLSTFRERYREELLQAPWNKIMNGDTPILGYRDPSYLFVYSNGVEAEMPISVEFNRFFLKYRYQNEDKSSNMLGKVDIEEIIAIIFSILALFFTYNAVSGEKESGTLKLILSNNIPRYEIILGKLIGNFMLLSTPLFVGFLISIIMLGFMNVTFITGQVLIRTLLLLIPTFLYILVLVSFGIFISCLTSNSKTSLAISFFLWIFIVLVIPNLSRLAGPILRPVQSEYVHERAVRAKMQEYRKDKSEKLKEIFQKCMVDPSNEKLWNEYTDLRAPIMNELDKNYEAQMGALEEDFNKKRLDQRKIILLMSRISPLSSFRYIFSSICGTSDLIKEEFFNRSKLQQKLIMKGLFDGFINDSVQVDSAFRGKVPNAVIGNIRGKKVPPKEDIFEYGFMTLKNPSIKSVLPDLIWLSFIGLASFMGAYLLFVKYDVR
jgi:ABC-type transport system involved in multi-copper enzyme maturation permease subunit